MGMLVPLLKQMLLTRKRESVAASRVPCVLNVGGGSKSTAIPNYFDGWRHDLLDIDPRGQPEIACDARMLHTLAGGSYDAIYCSHNLEHYYRHDALAVVRGFVHMLNGTGFAEIRVPDIAKVIAELRDKNLELDDILYESPAGPISAHDVIYGLQTEIQSSGQDFYAHKTGFTPQSLSKLLLAGGFQTLLVDTKPYLAVHALAFKTEPSPGQRALLASSWELPLQ
jgi:hypothetical protein